MHKISIISAVFLLSSCAAIDISSDAYKINQRISSGEVVATIHRVELSDFQAAQLTHSINQYHSFVFKYRNYIKDLSASSPIFDEIYIDYQQLRREYVKVEQIVKVNWRVYNETDQAILRDYEKVAMSLDYSISDLIAAGERHEVLMTTLRLGRILLALAASVKI